MKSNRRITRRILALVMILCMLTALTACGADDEDRQSRPSRNETTADVTATSTPIPTNTPVPTDTPRAAHRREGRPARGHGRAQGVDLERARRVPGSDQGLDDDDG